MYYLVCFILAIVGYVLKDIGNATGAMGAATLGAFVLIIGALGFIPGVAVKVIEFLDEEFPNFLRGFIAFGLLLSLIVSLFNWFTGGYLTDILVKFLNGEML